MSGPRQATDQATAAAVPGARKRCQLFCGLLNRKERWGLTFRGWCFLLLLLAGLGLLTLWRIHPFLAVTHRVQADFLVVEGWIPKYALLPAIDEFHRGHYQKVLSAGGPLRSDIDLDWDDTYAHAGANRLKKLGVPPEFVVAVPSDKGNRDRTYASALALRAWFEEKNISVKSMNVVTLGPHARRTRLLYERAFKGKVTIGIIAVEDKQYPPSRWWRYSEGVKQTLGETVAYLYARLLFHPSD